MCVRSILWLCRICSVDGHTYFVDVQTKCVIFCVLWCITVSAHFVRVNKNNIVRVLNHLWSFYVCTTDGRSLLTLSTHWTTFVTLIPRDWYSTPEGSILHAPLCPTFLWKVLSHMKATITTTYASAPPSYKNNWFFLHGGVHQTQSQAARVV